MKIKKKYYYAFSIFCILNAFKFFMLYILNINFIFFEIAVYIKVFHCIVNIYFVDNVYMIIDHILIFIISIISLFYKYNLDFTIIMFLLNDINTLLFIIQKYVNYNHKIFEISCIIQNILNLPMKIMYLFNFIRQ